MMAALTCGTGCNNGSQGTPAQSQARGERAAATSTGMRLIAPLPEGDWRLPNGDLAGTRFSPLDRINASNVHELQPVAAISTGVPHGHEGGPLIVNQTMYVVTPFPNKVMTLELKKHGTTLKWVYEAHPEARAVGIDAQGRLRQCSRAF